MVEGASFTSRFNIDNITQTGLLRLMEKIMSTRYDFVLYALFNLEPVKRFECNSDVRMLWSADADASQCILNLLEAFEFGDGK